MYKHIYDCFKHWYHGGQIYFYSDPHFNDPGTESFRKSFNTYLSDEEQLKKIKSVVHKLDTLVILGDIGDKEFLKSINAYKVLILGNHDAGATVYKDYVDEIYEGPIFISDKIVLSHEPISFSFALNIHGHEHNLQFKNDSNHFNVCAEHINYTPVSFKYIVKSGMLHNIKSIHRITIDNATERKLKKNNENTK